MNSVSRGRCWCATQMPPPACDGGFKMVGDIVTSWKPSWAVAAAWVDELGTRSQATHSRWCSATTVTDFYVGHAVDSWLWRCRFSPNDDDDWSGDSDESASRPTHWAMGAQVPTLPPRRGAKPIQLDEAQCATSTEITGSPAYQWVYPTNG